MRHLKITLLKIMVIIVLGMSAFARHTYYINPNFNDQSWVISKMNYRQLHDQKEDKISRISGIAFQSMIAFIFIFGIINGLFGYVFLFESRWLVVYSYLFLILISAFLFGVYKFSDIKWLFNAGSVIKNFVLSPVFTLVVFILFKFAIEQKKN